jgi:hypothetical protein
MKPVFKIILPILLALCTAGSVIVWDVFFKGKIDSVMVVVVKANQSIETKETITKDKLTVERRQREDLLANPVTSIDSVVGKDAKSFIAGNSMVTADMIDYNDLIPNKKKGELIRPIPTKWLYATASSMRRKDKADIYLIKDGTTAKQTTDDPRVEDLAQKNGQIIRSMVKEPILKDVSVLYARDTSGNEVVTNPEDKNSTSEQRLTSTSQIQQLELILNEDDFQKIIKNVLDDGYTLYIAYK